MFANIFPLSASRLLSGSRNGKAGGRVWQLYRKEQIFIPSAFIKDLLYLVSQDCGNRIPYSGWVMNKNTLFLMVFEAYKGSISVICGCFWLRLYIVEGSPTHKGFT